MSDFEKAIKELDVSIGELRDRVEKLEKKLDGVESLKGRVGTIRSEMNRRFDEIENSEDSNGAVESLKRQQTEIKDWLSKLDTEVAENSVEIEELK